MQFLTGELRVEIEAIESVAIHGDVYHDALVHPVDGGPSGRVRIASHLCPEAPSPGTRLVLGFLMGQVHEVRGAD